MKRNVIGNAILFVLVTKKTLLARALIEQTSCKSIRHFYFVKQIDFMHVSDC